MEVKKPPILAHRAPFALTLTEVFAEERNVGIVSDKAPSGVMEGAILCSLHRCVELALQACADAARDRGVQLYSEIGAGVPEEVETGEDRLREQLTGVGREVLVHSDGGALTFHAEPEASAWRGYVAL